jgi:acyl-coenzyme A thioesterase PaaI-like protein
MSFQALVEALQSVPFLATLGITVEEARPGRAVLRLPAVAGNLDHAGGLHTAALYAVGEAAAGVAVGTSPRLAGIRQMQKASGAKYLARATGDVTAHAELQPETVDGVLTDLEAGARARAEVVVQLMDGHGNDVGEVVSVFTFRRG